MSQLLDKATALDSKLDEIIAKLGANPDLPAVEQKLDEMNAKADAALAPPPAG